MKGGICSKKIIPYYDFYTIVSKFLIEKKYTVPENLYASGGSAGGFNGAIVNL